MGAVPALGAGGNEVVSTVPVLGGGAAVNATCTVSRLGSAQPLSATITLILQILPLVSAHSGKQSVAVSVSGWPLVRTVLLVLVVKLGAVASSVKLS